MQHCAWVTDVHLNFLGASEIDGFARVLTDTGADCILLTGDISEAPLLQDHLLRLADILLRPIYFVLGNHDAYRGSIDRSRHLAKELTIADPHLHWMPYRGLVQLGNHTALVGCDGIADAQFGDWEQSSVILNDFLLIEEFSRLPMPGIVTKLRQLAEREAESLRRVLTQAASEAEEIIVLTHVPPFREACWHEGEISSDDYLPWFACKAVGDVLRAVSSRFPHRNFTVLCGHTHSSGVIRPLPNLEVRTGSATYGSPHVQAVLVAR